MTSKKPVQFNYPSQDQFWSCINRLITFDDPLRRCRRLLTLTLRQLPSYPFTTPSAARLPLAYQDELFTMVFAGNKEPEPPALVLSLLLALEDLDRFTIGCFQQLLPDCQAQSEPYPNTLFELAGSDYGRQWLKRAAGLVPDWSRLLTPGPWSNDARAQFLRAWLDSTREITSKQISAGSMFIWRPQFHRLLAAWRHLLPGSFLPGVILLVEGATEELLFPHLSLCLGINLNELAVMVMPAGGANQVLRRYGKLRWLTRLPIVCVLDKDAGEQAQLLRECLKEGDQLFVLAAGEIEDVFDEALLASVVNAYLAGQGIDKQMEPAQLKLPGSRKDVLDGIWRQCGLGSFDKIALARTMAEVIRKPEQVPGQIAQIIQAVSGLAASSRCA